MPVAGKRRRRAVEEKNSPPNVANTIGPTAIGRIWLPCAASNRLNSLEFLVDTLARIPSDSPATERSVAGFCWRGFYGAHARTPLHSPRAKSGCYRTPSEGPGRFPACDAIPHDGLEARPGRYVPGAFIAGHDSHCMARERYCGLDGSPEVNNRRAVPGQRPSLGFAESSP